MNYEKIIVELLGRIQVLEEQVVGLMEQKKATVEKVEDKVTTENIRQYIIQLKKNAKANGKAILTLTARDIHGDLNLKSRYPMVCNAMRQCMKHGDVVIYSPESGYSSTLEIKYYTK